MKLLMTSLPRSPVGGGGLKWNCHQIESLVVPPLNWRWSNWHEWFVLRHWWDSVRHSVPRTVINVPYNFDPRALYYPVVFGRLGIICLIFALDLSDVKPAQIWHHGMIWLTHMVNIKSGTIDSKDQMMSIIFCIIILWILLYSMHQFLTLFVWILSCNMRK